MTIRRLSSFWPSMAILLILLGMVLAPSNANADACSAKKKFDIPFEILVAAKSSVLVPLLALDVVNARESDHGNVKADLSVNLTLEVHPCLEFPAVAPRPIRYPLGIILRNVTFLPAVPEEFKLPHEGDIIANVSFDDQQFSTALNSALPLPIGFQYETTLEVVSNKLDGTTFAIEIVGPSSIGKVVTARWVFDRGQPDFGLQDFLKQIGASVGNSRAAAVAEFKSTIRRKIDTVLAEKKFTLGIIEASELAVDWESWDRGNQKLTAAIAWPGAEVSVSDLLPKSAELRLDAKGAPHLSLPPLDTERLRQFLGQKIANAIPDAATLQAILKRFGRTEFRNVPLGWLQLRNAKLTDESLSVEVAFSIGGTNLQWQKFNTSLPLKEAAFEEILRQLVQTAATAVKEYAARMVERGVYDQVVKFVEQNGQQRLFGLDFQLRLKPPAGNELPPKPIVTLATPDLEVAIQDVGLTMDGVTPKFDWSTAHIEGVESLAKHILGEAGYNGSDLDIKVSNLDFREGSLSGNLEGNLLGTPFMVEFRIDEHSTSISLPDTRQLLVTALQNALDGQEISFSVTLPLHLNPY